MQITTAHIRERFENDCNRLSPKCKSQPENFVRISLMSL